MAGLKKELMAEIESLFGKDMGVTFDQYYDESNAAEMIAAFKSLVLRMLGPDASSKIFEKIARNHPELKKQKVVVI